MRFASISRSAKNTDSIASRGTAPFFLFAVAIFLAIYLRIFQIEPRGDDWLLLSPARQLLHHFGILEAMGRAFTTTFGDFWRPLVIIFYLMAQKDFLWTQILKTLCMFGLAWLVMRTALDIKISRWGAVALGAVLLLHQGFVIVIGEPDTWADVLCATTFLGLFLLGMRYSGDRLSDRKYVFGTAVLTLVTLLSKEAGVACFLTPLAFLLLPLKERKRSSSRGHLWAAMISLGLALVYLAVRLRIGVTIWGSQEAGYYGFSIGKNIPSNLGLALLDLLSPVNTVQVALGSAIWKLLSLCWVFLLLAACCIGCFQNKNGGWRLPTILAFLFFANQGPLLLMPHITEANMVRSLPLGLLLVAHCLSPLFVTRKGGILALAGAVLVLWMGFNLHAVHAKINGILNQHQMAAAFRQAVLQLMPEPPGHALIFLAEAPKERGYSVFHQPLLTALTQGEIPHGLRGIYGRESLEARLQVVPVSEAQPVFAGPYDFFINGNGQVFASAKTQFPKQRLGATAE